MTQTKKTFVVGAAILAGAGLIGKVIAAFYRIWLNDLIGPEGLTIYQIPYSYYAFLLVISTAGIPTAISKLVSEHTVSGDYSGARGVFRVARRVLLVTGLAATVLMIALSGTLANAAGEPLAKTGFIMLAPSLLLVCLLSAYRGYFQGCQQMTPSAASQVVEQVCRLVFGFGFAILWSDKGVAWSAAGAVFGVTVCEACTLAFLLGSYGFHIKNNPAPKSSLDTKQVAKRIIRIAVPVTLGASVMPLVSLTDTMTVLNRLEVAGFDAAQARTMFGILNGMVTSIINMPTVVTQALSISLVPAMTEALKTRSKEFAAQTAHTGVKLAIIVALPCVVGLALLAQPIMAFLSPSYSPENLALSAKYLAAQAGTLIFLAVMQTTNGLLQGIGKPILPVYALAAGAVVKIFLNYTLIAVPQLNIYGAVIGSASCYALASAINIYNVAKHTGMRFAAGKFIVRPVLAAGGMGVCVWLAYKVATRLISSTTVAMLGCIGLGVCVYLVLAIVLGVIERGDWKWIPGGSKVEKVLCKLHLYR